MFIAILLEKAMAPHSSTLAWKIPWTEEPGRLQSMGSLRVGYNWATLTFHFHTLEKDMATHSSILAWRIPGTGEPGGLPSMGSHRVGHDWSDLAVAAILFAWVKTGNHQISIKKWMGKQFTISSVQSFSHVQLVGIPWTAEGQTSLSITNSQRLFKLMSIELVMPSNHLILCHSLLLLPSIFPGIRVFSS